MYNVLNNITFLRLLALAIYLIQYNVIDYRIIMQVKKKQRTAP